MSALFPKTKTDEKTVVVVDIENGSVATALVRISPHESPKLFGETRRHIPFLKTHDADLLARSLERSARDAMLHTQEVGARIRAHDALAHLGKPEGTFVFLHAPWSSVRFEEDGRPAVAAVESFLSSIRSLHTDLFGAHPAHFHSFATATAPLLPSMYGHGEEALVAVVSSEMTEIILVLHGEVGGYATLPFGAHNLLRTLRSHGGMSETEAVSALRLFASKGHLHPHIGEILSVAEAHLAGEFAAAVSELQKHRPSGMVFVVAHDPFSSWFAHALTHEELEAVFTEGGTIRTVHPRHITPFIAAHARTPDLSLMLGSLFADSKLSGIK